VDIEAEYAEYSGEFHLFKGFRQPKPKNGAASSSIEYGFITTFQQNHEAESQTK
jgi:hypothetical protein